MRLIDADKLSEKLYELYDDVFMEHAETYYKGVDDAVRAVIGAETINPVEYAHWIEARDEETVVNGIKTIIVGGHFFCSKCKAIGENNDMFLSREELDLPNYCSCCGAKMI